MDNANRRDYTAPATQQAINLRLIATIKAYYANKYMTADVVLVPYSSEIVTAQPVLIRVRSASGDLRYEHPEAASLEAAPGVVENKS